MADYSAIERIDNLRAIGRPTDAERLLRTALADEPADAHLLWRLAAVLLDTKQHTEGLAAAQAAVVADPANPNAHRVHALLLAQTGDAERALDAAHAAVTLAPENAHTLVTYAYVLECAKRFADAAAVARRAVALAPHDTETHARVGDVAMMAGDHTAARRAYQEVLRLDPEHAAARRNLARLDHVGHRPRKALQGFVEAGRMDPDVPEVLTLVAAVMWQLSWRIRVGLVVAVVALIILSPTYGGTSWATRIVGATILTLAGIAVWWHVRDLPRGTHSVVITALRTDGLLTVTYVFIAIGLLVYVAVAITGFAPAAVIVWLLAGLMGFVAVLSRILAAARRFGSRRR